MDLSRIIIDKIKKEGPLSFHDFMELALYYPGLGYYTSGKEIFGKKGDYYTSPFLGNIYGQLIGKQLEEMWSSMHKIPMTIVEFGGGAGILCYDILNYLAANPGLSSHLKYYIIEKSPHLQMQQKKLLAGKVEWISSLDEINSFRGCILSNEVVDNFPVNLLVMKSELMEVYVDFKDKFTEVLMPAHAGIKEYFLRNNIQLPVDYRTEINMEAEKWIKHIAANLDKGYVLTIDYGFTNNEFYAPGRNGGTLACYYRHQINFCPYHRIGRQDITAHVNFSSLQLWGKQNGLDCTGYCNQGTFLRSQGITGLLRDMEKTGRADMQLSFQVLQLLLGMGNQYKILVQQKGVETKWVKGIQLGFRNI